MKLLLAGNWQYEWYEAACAESLEKLGVEVIPFRFSSFFRGFSARLQNSLPFPGPALVRLNRALFESAQEHRPDWVWVWRGTHVLPRTLRLVKARTGAKLISYNNDDPFGPRVSRKVPWHHRILWVWYIQALSQYDLNFMYRQINCVEAAAAGARNARVLKPYFVPRLHRPVVLTEDERRAYTCDVVYVGHYERDGREEYLRALIRSGLRVRLFGGAYWNTRAPKDLRDYFGPVRPVYGDEYAKALCGARLCLGVLSRLNRDSYTRRCFEIPACGQVLLCERTRDLEAMFSDGKEAVFFSTADELVDRAHRLIADHEETLWIAENGRRRVWADRHDVGSRMNELFHCLKEGPVSSAL